MFIRYRIFKRLLDPKAERRLGSVLEVNKYLEDRWLAKLGAEKALNGTRYVENCWIYHQCIIN